MTGFDQRRDFVDWVKNTDLVQLDDFTVPQNFRYVTPDEQPGLVELTRTRLNTNHGR